jgi:hypothetical protein
MSKFTFICEDEPMPFSNGVVTKRTAEFCCVSLPDVLQEFEMFLHGCGFHFDGVIDIVKEESDDLDEYTDKLFTGTPIPKE